MMFVLVNRTLVDGSLKLNSSVPDGPLLLNEKMAAPVRRVLPLPGSRTTYVPERVAFDPAPGRCDGLISAVYASLCSSRVSNRSGAFTRAVDVNHVWSSACPQNVTELRLLAR